MCGLGPVRLFARPAFVELPPDLWFGWGRQGRWLVVKLAFFLVGVETAKGATP